MPFVNGARRSAELSAVPVRHPRCQLSFRGTKQQNQKNGAAAQAEQDRQRWIHSTRIRAFIDVVDAEGFSAAARKASAGRRRCCRNMYANWRTSLEHASAQPHDPANFRMTEAGHTYYRTASEILKEIDNLADLVRDKQFRPASGRLTHFRTAHIRRCRYRPVADRFRQGASGTVTGNHLRRPVCRSGRGRLRRGRSASRKPGRLDTSLPASSVDFQVKICASPEFPG